MSAMPDLSDRLAACYTGVVHDVMRAMGRSAFTLPAELRPILPKRAMAGPAFTIAGEVVPGADPHETLLAWTGLLSQAPAGSICSMTIWYLLERGKVVRRPVAMISRPSASATSRATI